VPYHRVSIQNRDTGEVETFLARISPRGLAEWLANRDLLRAEGKPDRPPDVDSETLWTWVPWPGEEHLPFFHDWPAVAERGDTEAVYSISWRSHSGDRRAVLQVTASTDPAHGYIVNFSASDAKGDLGKEYPVDDEDMWEEVEGLIAKVNADAGWEVPKVTTYTDARWFESEMAVAEAEVAAGFLAMPEGRA
jgi:hypothetical protein